MSINDSYLHSSCLRPQNTENNIKLEIIKGPLVANTILNASFY